MLDNVSVVYTDGYFYLLHWNVWFSGVQPTARL